MRYSQKLYDEFLHPQNVGLLADASGVGYARYETCGDTARVSVRIDKHTISAIGFQACGCGPVIACASVLTRMVKGKSIDQAMFITPAEVAAELELPAPKMHCAQIAVSALQEAVLDHQRRQLRGMGGDGHGS